MTWQRVVLVVVGLPAAVAAAFAAWVWVSFSGGLDDMLDFDHPREGDTEVVAAEQRARADVREVTREVGRTMREAAGAPASGGVHVGVTRPPCVVGQHNAKRDDDYDLSCTLVALGVVVAPEVPGTGATVRRVDDALRGDGWHRMHPHDLGPRAVGGPSPLRYTRTRDGRAWQLLVEEADLSSLSHEIRAHGGGDLRDAAGRAVSLEQLVAGRPRDGYAVVVRVDVEYFRN